MAKEFKNLHETYVPRAVRLGVVSPIQKNDASFIEFEEQIPLNDKDGTLLGYQTVVKKVPVKDYYSQFKEDDFKLENLVANGVKLNEINVNFSGLDFQDRVLDRAKALDILGTAVDRIYTRNQIVEQELNNVNNE